MNEIITCECGCEMKSDYQERHPKAPDPSPLRLVTCFNRECARWGYTRTAQTQAEYDALDWRAYNPKIAG